MNKGNSRNKERLQDHRNKENNSNLVGHQKLKRNYICTVKYIKKTASKSRGNNNRMAGTTVPYFL
jgi:hypothetical protein